MTQTDIGTGWTKSSDGKEIPAPTGDDCRARSALANVSPGGIQSGPIFNYGTTKSFVATFGVAFADESTAKSYTAFRASSDGIECTRQGLSEIQHDADARLSVRTAAQSIEGLGTQGFEAYAQYQLQADDGSGHMTDANGTFAEYVYRVGATVMVVDVEQVMGAGDPPNLADLIGQALTSALAATYAHIKEA